MVDLNKLEYDKLLGLFDALSNWKEDGFHLKKVKMADTKGAKNRIPFRKGSFPRTRYTINKLETVEMIFDILANTKPESLIVWVVNKFNGLEATT